MLYYCSLKQRIKVVDLFFSKFLLCYLAMNLSDTCSCFLCYTTVRPNESLYMLALFSSLLRLTHLVKVVSSWTESHLGNQATAQSC